MGSSRRTFVKKSSLSLFATILGMDIPYGVNLPVDLLPIAITLSSLPGKSDQLTILNDRPINAETPAHLLDANYTPNNLFFVRNNGIPPESINAMDWQITFDGEAIANTRTLSLQEIKQQYNHYTYAITLECGGNGRKEFFPPAKGNQWGTGAVGCARWTGVRLADILNDIGIKNNAVYLGYEGMDSHLSGDTSKLPISRGVPIDKAMAAESLLVWQMNGKDLPLLNGFPVRLIFGGFPASSSGKWVKRISIRDKVHDGPKMGGQSYRVPCKPVAPGSKVADEDMCIIEKMPVKSLITFPKTGATIREGERLPVRGKAWTAARIIRQVEVSIDFGQSWQSVDLDESENRFAWQGFNTMLSFPGKGYYEVWARATDSDGVRQPMILPGWNPRGYLNNACHRIAIKVVA